MSELRPAPPRRWLDDETGAPSSFARAARGFREDAPTPLALERMWERLELNVAAQSVSPGWRMSTFWRGLSALVLVGVGAMFAFQGSQLGASVHKPVPQPEQPLPAAAEPVPQPVVDALPAAPEPVVLDAGTKIQPVNRVRAAAVKPKPTRKPAASDEVSLLVRARRLLHAQPEQALALTSQHSAQHPQGVFAEERELLAIEALRELGRREQVVKRSDKFLELFPKSAHRRRIEALRGQD